MDGVYVIFILMVYHVFSLSISSSCKSLFYASHLFNPNTWFSGNGIYLFLVGTAFMDLWLMFYL